MALPIRKLRRHHGDDALSELTGLIPVGIVVVIGYLIIKGTINLGSGFTSFLSKVGLGQSAAVLAASTDSNFPLNSNYRLLLTDAQGLLDFDTAEALAKDLYDNVFHVLFDDFAKAWGIISACKTRSDACLLAERFWIVSNGRELLEFFKTGAAGQFLPWDGFSDSHMNQIVTYVNSLP